jgi:hypothetical protein
MIDLSEYPRRKSGLLDLQGWQIDSIAQKMVLAYDPDIAVHPHALDIEGLVDCYMKQKIDYIRMSPNGNIFGMAVVDAQPIPVYVDDFDKPIWYMEDSNTIVIDTKLAFSAGEKESIYRETVGHESGHLTLQSEFLRNSGDRLPAFNSERVRSKIPNPQWADDSIAEWQATRYSSAALMCTCSVEVALLDWFTNIANSTYSARDLIEHIARVYQVTNETAYYRIREFKLFWYNFKNIRSFADVYR